MSHVPNRAQLERLRQAIATRLGLQFEDAKLELLASVATQRLDALGGQPIDDYVARLASEHDRGEIRALAERLTVGETYFFRNTNDLHAFVGAVLPERMRARRKERRLRLLSAGCSSGEEPYTLAMLIRQVPELASWDVTIRGIDVNPAAIARAAAGRYSAWSLRQTPAEMRARFFRPENRGFRLDDEVRSMVSFEERNLVEDDPRFWARGAFDVAFCRNVTMYFAPEVTRHVIARIASALAPGGFLFLGHAETLRGISTDFHLRQTHGTFYYQLREGGEAAISPVPKFAAAAEPVLLGTDAEWVEAIRCASERIAELTGAAKLDPRAGGSTPAATGEAPVSRRSEGEPAQFGCALDLLKQERFSDALTALGNHVHEHDTDMDVLVLRAVLLASSGDTDAAERVCARILETDELNAEAHYVKALCREHGRDRHGAMDHDRYALYLDPTFAMPRLHLGLMAKRAGDVEIARRELSRALVLLAAEEPSRILLLGGGFSRDALVGLCRAELRASGELS